jgi:hypothetical protein
MKNLDHPPVMSHRVVPRAMSEHLLCSITFLVASEHVMVSLWNNVSSWMEMSVVLRVVWGRVGLGRDKMYAHRRALSLI